MSAEQQQRYADLFRSESTELLAAVNQALLQLEEGGSPEEPVGAIFRAVHTMKGMSATMGYHAVAEFAHELESILDLLRRGDLSLSGELMDALFAATDALEEGVRDASESAPQSPSMVAVLHRLHSAAGVGSAPAAADGPAESAGVAVVEIPDARDLLEGPGVIVRVRQAADTTMPGVRAYMVVERVRTLGEVRGVSPPLETLRAAESPQAFAMRVESSATASQIEAAVRLAGDIEHVEVDVSGRTRRKSHAVIEVAEGSDEGAHPASRAARHVRIDLSRLDALMNLIGELVITRGRLLRLTAGSEDRALGEALEQANRLISDLQSEILTCRMVPVWQVFDRFPRLVRDAARQLGKDVTFVVEGKEIELDRSLLDEIGEPIVHLLRNAIDHGIEAPLARSAAGKPRAGRLTLSALRDRAAVLIRVHDDGRGVDRQRVLEQALASGLVSAEVEELNDEELFRCIAQPGFSTAASVSDLSGRGVGIDAVQTKVRELGGIVEMRTEPGKGTTVTIRLPLTLAIVRALLARSGDERYAVPLTHVRETLACGVGTAQRVKGKEVFVLREEVLPLLDLRDVVGQPAGDAVYREIVVLERGERRLGLVVDELLGQEDIVVKQFDAARGASALFSGATILADGAPALIMDAGSLLSGN